jgi:hypothetical protein
MALFAGSVRLVGDSGPPLDAVASVGEGRRLTLKAAGHHLGDWWPDELDVDLRPEGFVIQVEGEELVFATPDPEGFAVAVGIGDKPEKPKRPKAEGAKHRRSKAVRARAAEVEPKERTAVAVAEPPPVKTKKVRSLKDASPRLRAGAIALTLVAMAVFARPVLAALTLLVGGAGLIVGVASTLDSYIAVRIPQPFTVTNLLLGGLAFVTLGAGLTLF